LTSDNNNQKKCGFCGENIPVGAGRCPYCGSILEVTFDNNCRVDQPEVKPVNGDSYGQVNTEQQQTRQNAECNPAVSENPNVGEQQGNAGAPGCMGEQLTQSTTSPGAVPPAGRPDQQTEYTAQTHNAYKPYNGGGYPPNYNYNGGVKQPLSNGMKVFLTVLFTVLPGIGQLAGIIAAIVFMNSDGDSDRKSFGVALLVASLIMFVISCIGCFVLMILSANQMNLNY
jgi:hypothetical protein